MALHQIDYQFYCDGANNGARYSWSQTWYDIDSSVNTTGGPTYAALIAFYAAMVPVGATRNALRARRLLPTFHDYGTFTVPNPGIRAVSSPLTLLNTARVRFTSGGKLVGYKRLRLPLQLDEIEGGRLTGSFITLLSGALATLLAASNLSNWKGEPVDGFDIAPDVRMWQLRHGTKRSARAVL